MRKSNTIDYVEFWGGEINATKAFYAKAFGWTYQDYGPHYAEIHDAGLVGGFQSDPNEQPFAPLVVIYTEDLDAAHKAVVDAGGEMLRRFAFPGGERFHFRDPAGNELAVWTDKV